MLETFRRSQTAAKFILGGLAAMFVLWGVGGVGFDSGPEVVARVYDETITRRDLDRESAAIRRRWDELFRGAALPAAFDPTAQALDQLVESALLRHEAHALGLAPTDGEVIDAITAMPELQEGGRFSRETLERYLRATRDRGEFEQQIRTGILRERFEGLATDGLVLTDGEIAQHYRFEREQVNLGIVRIAAAELAKTVEPTEADLEAARAAHEDRYRTPERVRVRYVAYTPGEFAEQAAPSETRIAEYYESHLQDRFTAQDQVRARHVLVKVAPGADDAAKAAARAKAEGLLADARAGAEFAALATKHSEDPGSAAQGGDLGFFPRGRMVPAFDAAAFALEPGQLSEVVESPFGFHVIRVEEKRPGGPKALDEVRDEIVTVLRDEQALELARMQAESDQRAMVRGATFAEAVGSRPVTETPPFGADEAVPGVGRLAAFNDAAFGLDPGDVSGLVEGERAFYLLSPIERVAPVVPPLAEIRERVAADLRRDRGEALAKERAEALLAKAREIGLDAAATEAGLAVEETGSFERRATTLPKLGAVPDLKADAFRLTPEAPVAPTVYTVGGDGVVVALRTRTAADETGLAAERDAIESSLLQQRRAALVTRYMDELKTRAQQAGALQVRTDVLARG